MVVSTQNIESCVVDMPAEKVWSMVRAMDFKWNPEVKGVDNAVSGFIERFLLNLLLWAISSTGSVGGSPQVIHYKDKTNWWVFLLLYF